MPKLDDVPVFVGDRFAFAFPNTHGKKPPKMASISLGEAARKTWPDRAGVAPYFVEKRNSLTRLAYGAVPHYEKRKKRVLVRQMWLDIDNEPHEPWSSYAEIEEAKDKMLAAVADLGEPPFWYATPRGMRIVWVLPKPVEAGLWKSYFMQFKAALFSRGLKVDPCSAKWNTIFRPPKISNGKKLPIGPDHVGVLLWQPEKSLQKQDFVEQVATEKRPMPDLVYEKDHEVYKTIRRLAEARGLANGRPVASEGSRRNTMWSVAGKVASAIGAAEPEQVFAAMRRSVTAMQEEAPKGHPAPTLEELWEACLEVCAKDSARRDASKTEYLDILEGLKDLHTNGLTEEQAPAGPTLPKETREEVVRRLLVSTRHDTCWYVLNEQTGGYSSRTNATHLPAAFRENSPRITNGMRDKRGQFYSVSVLSEDYHTEVSEMAYVLGQKGNRLNKSMDRMELGVCPLRDDIEPEFNQGVAEWLCWFGGDHVDKLLDWLACVPQVQEPLCALYACGPPESGKGLLVNAIANLWKTKPTPFAQMLSSFNSGMRRSPLLWADEYIPRSEKRSVSGVLRDLIGNRSHELREKYVPSHVLLGCPRLVVTANNAHVISFDEQLSRDDYDAVIQRLGFVQSAECTPEFLRTQDTESWVETCAIEKHVLWLAKQRPVKRSSRFLVAGWETPWHRRLKYQIGWNVYVMEAIIRLLAEKTVAGRYMRIKDGLLYITPEAISEVWPTYWPSRKLPSMEYLEHSLDAFRPDHGALRIGGSRPVCMSWVYEHAERVNMLERVKDSVEALTAATSEPEKEAEAIIEVLPVPDTMWASADMPRDPAVLVMFRPFAEARAEAIRAAIADGSVEAGEREDTWVVRAADAKEKLKGLKEPRKPRWFTAKNSMSILTTQDCRKNQIVVPKS